MKNLSSLGNWKATQVHCEIKCRPAPLKACPVGPAISQQVVAGISKDPVSQWGHCSYRALVCAVASAQDLRAERISRRRALTAGGGWAVALLPTSASHQGLWKGDWLSLESGMSEVGSRAEGHLLLIGVGPPRTTAFVNSVPWSSYPERAAGKIAGLWHRGFLHPLGWIQSKSLEILQGEDTQLVPLLRAE